MKNHSTYIKLKSNIEFLEWFLNKTKYADNPNDQYLVTTDFKNNRKIIANDLKAYKKELK